MNNFFEQFKNTAKLIRMSETEKTRMRAEIFGAAAPVRVPTPSPYVASFAFSTLLNLRTAVAGVLVIILAGSSTAYAAQGALPGDLLYAVKVSVNEKVELALATTPEQKIKTEVRFADRRIAEVQALDAEGRLALAVAQEIEMEFDKHAERALALAQEVAPPQADAGLEVATMVVEDEPVEVLEIEAEGDAAVARNAEVSQTMMMVTVEMPAVATATVDVEDAQDESDDLFESLQEKKKIFKELRERAAARGEVRGASSENRNDEERGKGQGKKD